VSPCDKIHTEESEWTPHPHMGFGLTYTNQISHRLTPISQ
jgi:hypothetical protein